MHSKYTHLLTELMNVFPTTKGLYNICDPGVDPGCTVFDDGCLKGKSMLVMNESEIKDLNKLCNLLQI